MIKQGTTEWIEMRKSKIGASDASAILGVSPYLTAFKLWEQKLGLAPPQFQTQAMSRGLELEDRARLELEKMTELCFLPLVKYHSSIPYMIASLDGMDLEGKHIAEIKCANRLDHELALSGQVPEKYIPQLQHQLEVCELDMVHYFSFDGSSGTIVKFYRDDTYIKKMLKKEAEFWECMQTFVAPEMTDRDYEVKDDESWMRSATQWKVLNQQLKEIEAKEELIRKNLIMLANRKNSIGAGVKLTRSLRKGNVDYSSIPELQEVELEKYRKNPVECYKITLI